MDIKNNYPLSNLTTFRIGGVGTFFAEVVNEKQLLEALDFAKQKSLPIQVFGGGSNILVSDKGFNGLVIHNNIKGLTIEDSGLVSISAGENWDDVVAKVVEKYLAGIECLSGVPGSSGGAVVQNIGAYGQTISDCVTFVSAIEVMTGKAKEFLPKECQFEYRGSWFKRNPNKYVVTKFQLQLKPQGEPTVTYPDVRTALDKKSKVGLSDVREAIIQIRDRKGYLIMPGHASYQTAGSYFKNPIVTREQFEQLKPIFGDVTLNRFWEIPNGIKLAAAYLMQEAGFDKSYREGNVGISPKHSLSIVNFGGASAVEVKAFADKIKHTVLEKFDVKLEEEVLFVGEI